jgi:hypothetical protein
VSDRGRRGPPFAGERAWALAHGQQGVTAMPKGKSAGPSVEKPDTYEALRDKGMPKERAAKISNAQAAKEKKKKSK